MRKIIALAAIITILLASCEKASYQSYIHNDTDQGVYVEYCAGQSADTTIIHVEAHGVTEINDYDRYTLVGHYHGTDSVVFRFDDGTRTVHVFSTTHNPDGTGTHVFTPEQNNILASDFDPYPSWILENTRGNHFRYDYHIK